MALFLSTGTGDAANYQSEINDRVFRKASLNSSLHVLLLTETIILACATRNRLQLK